MSDEESKKDKNELQSVEQAVQQQPDQPSEWAPVVLESVKEYVGMKNKKSEIHRDIALEALKTDRTKFIGKIIMLAFLIALLIILAQYEMLTMEVAVGIGVGIGAMFNLDSINWPTLNSD